jgi:NMD protein affecting ribosome stability and mRNA decay
MSKAFFRMSDDGPDTKRVWFTLCASCGWEEDESHEFQSECNISVCPKCGSDDVIDESEEV